MTFARPTLTEIDARLRADIESAMDAVPIVRQGSVLAGLARGAAGASHTLHGHIDQLYRALFPDTATGAELERMAGFRGLNRGEPAAATGTVTITGTTDTVLPAGAALGHFSGVELTTTAAAVIIAGTATVAVAATQVGPAGNLAAGAALTFLSPTAGIDTAATVAAPGMAGGAEAESDARLLQRLLLIMREPPHGGAAHDYVRWALDVPGVTRVWFAPGEMGRGTVTIRFTVDDAAHGPAPTEGEVAAVAAYIASLRPVTADVYVVAPVLSPVAVTLELTPDTAATRAAVTASLDELFTREGAPGTGILLSHIREAISVAAGEVDHVLAAPVADIDVAAGVMPVLGAVTFT